MIEINLLVGRKEGGLAALGGIDFSKLNYKMLVLAIIMLYVPEGFMIEMWGGEIAKVEAENKKLSKEYGKF